MDKQPMKILIYFLVALLPFSHGAAQANSSLGLSLFGFKGERAINQSSEDPLLLYITIENSAAIFTNRQNTRNTSILNDYANTEEYKNLPQEARDNLALAYPRIETPPIVLGSNSMPAVDLINIQVRDQNGDNISLATRLLEQSEPSKQVTQLDHTRSLRFTFVVESEQLRALAQGRYHLIASIDTRNQPNMWQGLAYSNAITVSLSTQHPQAKWADSNARATLRSYFLLADNQYKQAQQHANLWTQRAPKSVDAWSSLGDALVGLKQPEAALEAYNKALSNFFIKYGNPPEELPSLLIQRIDEL